MTFTHVPWRIPDGPTREQLVAALLDLTPEHVRRRVASLTEQGQECVESVVLWADRPANVEPQPVTIGAVVDAVLSTLEGDPS